MRTRLDPHVIAEAVDAWCTAYPHATKTTMGAGGYRGVSADGVLERHGIRWSTDRALYLAYEAIVRAGARRQLGIVGRRRDPVGRLAS